METGSSFFLVQFVRHTGRETVVGLSSHDTLGPGRNVLIVARGFLSVGGLNRAANLNRLGLSVRSIQTCSPSDSMQELKAWTIWELIVCTCSRTRLWSDWSCWTLPQKLEYHSDQLWELESKPSLTGTPLNGKAKDAPNSSAC